MQLQNKTLEVLGPNSSLLRSDRCVTENPFSTELAIASNYN